MSEKALIGAPPRDAGGSGSGCVLTPTPTPPSSFSVLPVSHGHPLTTRARSDAQPRAPCARMLEFITTHRDFLRQLVLRDPGLLFRRFRFILEHPCVLREFADVLHARPLQERQDWFYDNLERAAAAASMGAPSTVLVFRGEGSFPALASTCNCRF